MTTTYRASEFGRCIKASAAERLGMKKLPQPERMDAIYERGNVHEEACISAMNLDGWHFLPPGTQGLPEDEGQHYITLAVDNATITGHLDGLGYGLNPDKLVTIELKSPQSYDMFYRAYKTNDYTNMLANRYAWQTSIYMVATGLECVVACWDEERGVRYFVIEVPIHDLSEIANRVTAIETLVAAGDLGTCTSNDYPCPFVYLHEPEQRSTVDDPALIEAAIAYTDAKERAKLAETQAKGYSTVLQHGLALGRFDVGPCNVTIFETSRTTLDKDAMLADGIDVTKYEKKSKSRSLRVERKDSDG